MSKEGGAMLLIRNTVVFLGVALLLLPVGASQAEEYGVGGQLYLSFIPDGRDQSLAIEPGTPFDFYLIVDLDLAGGDPYEMIGFEGQLSFGTELFLSEIEWIGDLSVDMGDGLVPGSYDFSRVLSSCAELADGPNVICTFHAQLNQGVDELFVDIGPGARQGFGGQGPGWVSCDYTGYLFEPDGPPTTLSITSPTAVESETWAGIKTLYR
jgi:hypothetical protein